MSVKDVEGWKEKCFYILEDEVRYEFGEFVDENELKEILASVYGDLDWCRASELLDDDGQKFEYYFCNLRSIFPHNISCVP